MTRPIYIINGPNLNRLGTREPEIYGRTTLAEIEQLCRTAAGAHPLEFRQSNAEHEIIGWIHEAIDNGAGIIINPAAYSFTSIAMLDALKMVPGTDHRAAHLQHPPPRADLPPFADVAGGDRRHRGAGAGRLSGRGGGHAGLAPPRLKTVRQWHI